MAQLLHALNQPVTGLQCSLELAVARPRARDDYIRVLQDGLELTARIRILLKAARELVEIQRQRVENREIVLLNELLEMTVNDLIPVAEQQGVSVRMACPAALPVKADRVAISALMFRFLEAVLSLTAENRLLQILASTNRGFACLVVQWQPASNAKQNPLSEAALALAISEAGWKQAGAECEHSRTNQLETCSLRMPLATSSQTNDWEI